MIEILCILLTVDTTSAVIEGQALSIETLAELGATVGRTRVSIFNSIPVAALRVGVTDYGRCRVDSPAFRRIL